MHNDAELIPAKVPQGLLSKGLGDNLADLQHHRRQVILTTPRNFPGPLQVVHDLIP